MGKNKGVKIKRYKNSFNTKRERNTKVKKIISFVLILAVLFALGWFLAKPGLDAASKLWYSIKNGTGSANSQVSASGSSTSDVVDESSVPEEPQPPQEQPQQTDNGKWANVALSAVNTPESAAALAKQLASEGISHAAITLKDERGYLYYQSGLPMASNSIASTTINPAEIAKALYDNGVIPCAVISAFEDSIATYTNRDAGVHYNGQKNYLWLNNSVELGGRSWLNPYNEAAQNYITDIIREISSFGFKEIIIKGAQFPTGYGLNMAYYGESLPTKAACLTGFVQKAETAAAEQGLTCWFSYPQSAVGENDLTAYEINPLGFKAKNVMVEISAAQTGEMPALDSAWYQSVADKAAQNEVATLCLSIIGTAPTAPEFTNAVTQAQAAGFTNVFVK